MTMKDEVRSLMSDGKKRTAGDIARELNPGCDSNKESYKKLTHHVWHALTVMETWGEVERVGTTSIRRNQVAIVWRAVA